MEEGYRLSVIGYRLSVSVLLLLSWVFPEIGDAAFQVREAGPAPR
jgi:hypothetical protein